VEDNVVDERFRLRGAQNPSRDIVIVALDQRSLTELDTRPPINREVYAQLLDQLRAFQPSVLAVFVRFTGKTNPTDDQALVDSVQRNGPVVLATLEGMDGPIPVPAGERDLAGAVIASAAVDGGGDNVVRRMLLAPVALKTFAVRVAELHLSQEVSAAEFHDNAAWIAFRGPPGSFPTYSLIDVLHDRVPASAFRERIVLVGVTDPTTDVLTTSVSSNPMSGVELQANATQTILDGFPLRAVPLAVTAVLTLCLIATPILLIVRFPALIATGVTIAVLVLFLFLSQLAFRSGWIVPTILPMTAALFALIGSVGVDSFINLRQKQELERTLGDLLPPPAPAAFFISYRRREDEWAARDIRADLVERFGDATVFLDRQSINTGEEWPERIRRATRWCSVMLVLIGRNWLESIDGQRRIDDPTDWVRLEIEAVLQRPEALVIPVLLDGASVPSRSELPAPLERLADRQSFTLPGDDLRSEIDVLLASIERGRVHEASAAGAESHRFGHGVDARTHGEP
jgi:CHASE2 domain-containing sensor protein